MTSLAVPAPRPPALLDRLPLYYGWVNMTVGALAMVGTLPGRTQGLGLITEPLLRDLQIDRVGYAQINLWATLIGSLFCLGFGRLLDRFGSRAVMTVIVALLGAVVVVMAGATGFAMLFVLVTLTRGLGQSALSVASLSLVGQWFGRRLPKAMAFYSVIMSIGFMAAFYIVGTIVTHSGWRVAWSGLGWLLLLGLLPLVWFTVRRDPESCGLQADGQTDEQLGASAAVGATFREALRSPAFWVFALATSIYNLVASGIGLFNESILAERGFAANVYHQALAVTAITSLAGNFLGGWLSARWSANRLMALAMGLLMLALLVLPFLRSVPQVMLWAVFMGVAGGFVIVIFFGFWGRTFGRAHLGKIQGAAQMMTVVASAVGPLLLAQCVAVTGSYALVFYVLAGVIALLALAAWTVKVPTQWAS